MLSIKEILTQDTLKQLVARSQTPAARIRAKWEALVGRDVAAHSQPYALRHQKLFIRVSDSTHAFDYRQRYYLTILKRVQHEVGRDLITDLIFRVGQLDR